MHRRPFLHFLAALLFGGAGRAATPARPPAFPALPPKVPARTRTSLDEWLRLPMLPIIDEHGLIQVSEPERPTARRLLGTLLSNERATDFHYLGGSEPGFWRRVLPILLFQKIEPEEPPLPDAQYAPWDPNDLIPTYLLAWCTRRQSPRTFRLDRIQLDPEAWKISTT
jgi:hypothetical protein